MIDARANGRASRVEWLTATAVVTATAVACTWPLALSPWRVPEHQDPLFSIWRLYQWARNLAAVGAGGWFEGNMFHPTPQVLLLSDITLLPALVTAPFIAAGLPPVLAYSALFWIGLVGAGLAMYAAARVLAATHWAALVAAVLFVGAPTRMDQVMHFEMFGTAFLPLAVIATARAMEGRRRPAWAIGAAMAGMALSGIYLGVFLFTLWPVLAGVEWLRRRGAVDRGVVLRAGASVAIAALLLVAYARPYREIRSLVGDRQADEVARYSATWASYLHAPPVSRAWGWTAPAGGPELWLFPGLTGSVLAATALASPAAPWVASLAVTTLVAADASRGSHGLVYPVLWQYLEPYRGLRVPARFGLVALATWSLLAAIGATAVARRWRPGTGRTAAGALVLALMAVESAADVNVRRLPSDAPPVYTFLGHLPPTVIAHAPLPDPAALPGAESDFIYFAQYHRHRLVNGNSGFFPPAYVRLLEAARDLPGDRAMGALRAAGVEYLVVHERYFPSPDAMADTIYRLERRHDLQPQGTFADEAGTGSARIYRLLPP
ncbi:MAG: hypothetical protein R2708_20395 [Vicinamibacterales bacterium]